MSLRKCHASPSVGLMKISEMIFLPGEIERCRLAGEVQVHDLCRIPRSGEGGDWTVMVLDCASMAMPKRPRSAGVMTMALDHS